MVPLGAHLIPLLIPPWSSEGLKSGTVLLCPHIVLKPPFLGETSLVQTVYTT